VIRVAIAYFVIACVLIAISFVLFPFLGVPDWGTRLLPAVCALGFPVALALSWIYERTSGGMVRNAPISRSSAKRLDVILFGVTVTVLSLAVASHFWSTAGSGEQDGLPQVLPDEAIQSQVRYPDNSIAVLPFVNMSDDADNEYFSDGISEELLNLLARVRELRVISRSSAFSFKGKEVDIPTVAQKLNVAHVLEGSVRKSGNRVRITAQLIDVASDSHLWSGTYDREMGDIFAIQDEIAASVVAELKVRLLGTAPTSEEINPEAYTLYLQARHLGRQYSAESMEHSNALYQQIVDIEHDYVPAWSGLSTNYLNQAANGLLSSEEGFDLARSAAEKALAIDPGYAPVHVNLGWIAYGYNNDAAQAARHYERALELDPANIYAIRSAATLLNSINRPEEAVMLGQYFTARDPLTASGHTNLGSSYLLVHRWDEAIASYQATLKLSPGYIGAYYRIGVALLLKGDTVAALDAFSHEKDEEYQVKGKAMALHDLGRHEEFEAKLAELITRWGSDWPSEVAHVFAYIGDADNAFQWLNQAIEQNEEGLIEQIFHPFYDAIHKDPRWDAVLRRMGCSPEQLDAIQFNVILPEESS